MARNSRFKLLGLRTQLALALGGTAFICVLLIGVFANIQLQMHFKEYIQESQSMTKALSSYSTEVYYNEVDRHFIQTLNEVILSVGFAALILAVFVATWLSEKIARPIVKVITATKDLESGQWMAPLSEDFSTKEIRELSATVNQLAMALEREDKLRKRLTADVAHELRTPLATLQTHLEAMIDGVWEPTISRLSSCHEEALRLSRLVGDLENLAHYDSEQLILDKKPTDLFQLCQQVVQNYEGVLVREQLEVTVTGKSTMALLDGDKISQVLVNLLSNAIKFTPKGGHISIELTQTERGLHLMVEDTGIGIAPEDLGNIFERFYRTDLSRTRMTGGSGIGLALVRAIVKAHGGEVTVASKLGVGSTFYVFLPLQLDH